MSWFVSTRQFVAKYGKAAGFVAKRIVANAVPGGALVGDVIESVLNVAQESAEEGEKQAEAKATREELRQIGEMLEVCLGPLSKLCDRVYEHSGFGEVVDCFIRSQLTTQQEVQDGFRNLGVIFSCFDRLDKQNRELLRCVGYGNDLIESLMPLMKRLTDTVEFVEEMRAAGVQPGDLTSRLGKWEEVQRDIWAGQASQAIPKLAELDKEQPTSVCVKVSKAVGEVLSNDLLSADQTLRQAAKLHPGDLVLEELSRNFTQATMAAENSKPGIPTSATSPALKVGMVLDGWRLTELLGRGGQGMIFRAEKAGEVRALKTLLPEFTGNSVVEAQFRREIAVLAGLDRQPHLVHYDDFNKTGNHWYFLMEFIDGESLHTRLQRGPLPIEVAVAMFQRLAGYGGLASAHAKGVVHRDVKPANILLRTTDDVPVLVDFGLALLGVGLPGNPGHTEDFAAPEQLRRETRKKVDTRSDVYSLAGTLFYSLTRQRPYEFHPTRLPKELEPLREVFAKGLDQWQDNRPKDAGQLAEMLRRVAASLNQPRTPGPTGPRPTATRPIPTGDRPNKSVSMIYAPAINPQTFLHFSWEGESCALRNYTTSNPTPDYSRSTSDVVPLIEHEVRYGAGTNRQAVTKVDHWRRVTAELNQQHNLAEVGTLPQQDEPLQLGDRPNKSVSMIYAPEINPDTFLHFSWEGESCALRNYTTSNPTPDYSRSTSDVVRLIQHEVRYGRGTNRQAVTKVDHWRQVTAELNEQYGIGTSDSE